MESPHPDERPAKKRRFFAQDPSPARTDDEGHANDAAALDGFDVGMLQAVVGELPYPTLRKLKDASSSDVERGGYAPTHECVRVLH